MTAKKLGKAKIDLKKELWRLVEKEGAFLFNRRLVDTRPEVKEVRATLGKAIQKSTPPVRKYEKREQYVTANKEYRKQMNEVLTRIYQEMLEDSHTTPIKLRRDRDYDHKSDWRYCLYKGFVYQFDKPGYSNDEMIRQIEMLEASAKKTS